MRQRRSGDDRRIGDLDAVVHRVAFLQAAQDRDGVLDVGFADKHFLESSFESGVLLDVFAVFVQRGRADAVQFAARQRRLQHVAGVHGTFGLAGADHGVQFVDEEDDLAFILGQVVQYGFEALLEFAAEFRTGDQRAHIQRQHALALQSFGHFAVDDALREAFDDSRLAYAGLADEHRIVLGAALQHLDGAADFFVAADDRIEFSRFSARGEIDGVFLQGLTLLLGVLALHFLAAAHRVDGRFEFLLVRTRGFQRATGVAAVVQRREYEQFAGDEGIAALLRKFVGDVEQARKVVANVDVAGLPGDFRQLFEGFAKTLAQQRYVDARLRQQGPRAAALLVKQGNQQMHGFDDIVVATDRQRLCVGDGLLETRGEFVHAHRRTPVETGGWKQGGDAAMLRK